MHININILDGDPSGDRGVSRPGGQGSKFYVLSSEPKEHKSFCPDTRPGGPVTGATRKCFMCKSFTCLFCSLEVVVSNFSWRFQGQRQFVLVVHFYELFFSLREPGKPPGGKYTKNGQKLQILLPVRPLRIIKFPPKKGKITPKMQFLSWWTFRIFLIFFWRGKGESEAPGGGGVVGFLLKIPGGGGGFQRGFPGGLFGANWEFGGGGGR